MSEHRAPLRVLYVEDTESDSLLVTLALRRAGYSVHAHRVMTADAMQAALHAEQWDLVISDFTLPEFDAPRALVVLQQSGHDLPFIIVSGTIDEEQAVHALRAGAHDFITKGNLARLAPAIARELRDAGIRRRQHAAERQLRFQAHLLDTVGQAVIATDLSGAITYWNRFAETLYGWPAAEVVGRPILEIITAASREQATAIMRRLQTGAAWTGELVVRRRDGTEFPALVTDTPIHDDHGALVGIVGVSIDITERKQTETQIQQQVERLAALRAIDQAITGSLDLRLTLDVFLDQVLRQLGVHAADILLLDARAHTLSYTAGRGFRSSAFQRAHLPLGEGRAGRAALERRIVVETNPQPSRAPSMRTGLLGGDQFVSYYGVPLLAKGQVLGVLELFHRAALQPDPEWLEFLEALAGQAAIAIENATLFDGLQRSHQDLTRAYDATIEGWSRALDLRDKETEGHSQRVTEMTLRLARALYVSEEALVHLRRGALLHDIGKMGIPDRILLKPELLSEDEWVIMRQHPTFAFELLSPIAFLRPALDIPYCHHEKWDGTGYPRGLAGEAIPLAARLFAVVDVWDALRSDRPYRPAWPLPRVLEHVRALGGNHLDPRVVEAFLGMVE